MKVIIEVEIQVDDNEGEPEELAATWMAATLDVAAARLSYREDPYVHPYRPRVVAARVKAK